MSIKRELAITVLDSEKINEINKIIVKNTEIVMQSSSHIYFDTQPINPDEIVQDITFFQIEADDKASLEKKLNTLIEKLDQVNVDYALRDQDTGEMLVYVNFVGVLDIDFDGIKIIKEGTYAKIDELKNFKTELGICKGYKPDFRPKEAHTLGNMKLKTEKIYLFCHSEENLLKLKEILSEKIMEINPELKLGFREYSEKDIEKPN
jgi:hypothetical protein